MSDVRITVSPPTPNSQQRPIFATRVERTLDAATLGWTEIDTLLIGDPQEIVLQQVDPGTHFFRAITIDDAGDESPGNNEVSVTIGFELPSDGTIDAVVE